MWRVEYTKRLLKELASLPKDVQQRAEMIVFQDTPTQRDKTQQALSLHRDLHGGYSSRALMDLDRLFDFLAENDPVAAGVAAEVIIDAVQILARHPYVGRPVRGSLRELVISHGRSGYVALYRVIERSARADTGAETSARERLRLMRRRGGDEYG